MFVVFEGIDGSGKTTISNMVVERLRARGLSVKHLRAEGKFVSTVSESIRSLARDSRNIDLVPRAEFLLYVARDVQLIEEALRDALLSHDIVLADRFLFTAEVLARFGRRLPEDYIRPVLTAAAGGLSPDLVVLVDVDPTLARARRKASKLITKDQRPPSRKGLSGVGLQHRLRRGYLELARESKERWVTVRNEALLEDSVREVSDLIHDAVREGPASAVETFSKRRQEVARAAPDVSTKEGALNGLLQWLEQRAEREPQVAAYLLSGLAGERVDSLRKSLAQRVPDVMLAGLSGMTDEVSWALRESLAEAYPQAVVRSLGGIKVPDPRAHALRKRLLEHAPIEVAKTLSGLDDAEAWNLRDVLRHTYLGAVMGSLNRLDSARAWELRESYLTQHAKGIAENYELARIAAKSVQGVAHPKAWEIRDAAKPAAPLASLSSLSGLNCDRSFEVRAHYLPRAPKTVMETLRTLSDARAWDMRRAVAMDTKEALDSVAGLDDPEAWELRESYADVWPSTVIKTLGPLADSERGHALLTRQLLHHSGNISLLKHAAAIALGVHRSASLSD